MFNPTTPVPVPLDPAATAWTPDEVALALKISVRNLTNVRKNDPSFPKPRMLGDCPRWSPELVRGWLAWSPPVAEVAPVAEVTVPAPRKKGRVQ